MPKVSFPDELVRLVGCEVKAVGRLAVDGEDEVQLGLGLTTPEGARLVLSLGPHCWLFDADEAVGEAKAKEPGQAD